MPTSAGENFIKLFHVYVICKTKGCDRYRWHLSEFRCYKALIYYVNYITWLIMERTIYVMSCQRVFALNFTDCSPITKHSNKLLHLRLMLWIISWTRTLLRAYSSQDWRKQTQAGQEKSQNGSQKIKEGTKQVIFCLHNYPILNVTPLVDNLA
jgi:hypothetical protein